MKKFLLLLLTVSMVFSAIPFSVSAEGGTSAFYESPLWVDFYDTISWDNINNYIDYDNGDGQKTEGYRPGKITVFLTEEFMSSHASPVPDDFKHPFIDIGINVIEIVHEEHYAYNRFDLIADRFSESGSGYTEDDIIEFIDYIGYISGIEFVECALADYVVLNDISKPERWEVYDNYFYYDNADGHKTEGYYTQAVLFEFIGPFEEYLKSKYEANDNGRYVIDSSCFPEIQDKVVSIELGVLGFACVTLEKSGEEVDDYTEEHIDEFVQILKYLSDHPFVFSVSPDIIFVDTDLPPIPSDSETQDTTDDPENGGFEESTSADPEKPEETTAAETAKDDSDKAAQKNYQTGDGLYFFTAAAVLAFAVFAFVSTLKRRAKEQ